MKRFKILYVVVILGLINFYLLPTALGYNNYSTSPDVWVIDSTYRNHGQTVTDIIKNEAPNADVHFEPVSNGKTVSSDKLAQVIRKAVDKGAEVINLSLGASSMSQTLAEAIDYARNKGTTIVAAAGNNGRINYPAAYKGVVSVGAINPVTHRIARYSSRGQTYAKGRAPNGMRGTSFAAPRVAGRIAHKMYKDDIGTSEATKYVVGKRDNSNIGTSLPELVKRDVLLDLLTIVLIDSILRDNFSNLLKSSYSSFTRGLNNQVSSDIKKSHYRQYKKIPDKPSSGIFAPDIIGRRNNLF